jgi:LuxR family maltose regulon positive regulatory protein
VAGGDGAAPRGRGRPRHRARPARRRRTGARRHGVRADDELSYLREYEHLTLARILGARHPADAVALLRRLRAAAEAGGRTGTVIEILVVLALAHREAGDGAAARASLARALTLAEPEGYVRVFTGEGEPMAALLADLTRRQPSLRRLTAALSSPADRAPRPARRDDLVEPLSDRELDVMRLLAGDLDGPSIARQLVVSLNTVRTHTKHIYAKLGVTNRRAAVRRAHQLNLLSRSAR